VNHFSFLAVTDCSCGALTSQ